MTNDDSSEGIDQEGDKQPPTAREVQQPIGPVAGDDTWLSGDDQHDPLREEAAERASRAVEPGRPRE
jgi:hypothetical protein